MFVHGLELQTVSFYLQPASPRCLRGSLAGSVLGVVRRLPGHRRPADAFGARLFEFELFGLALLFLLLPLVVLAHGFSPFLGDAALAT